MNHMNHMNEWNKFTMQNAQCTIGPEVPDGKKETGPLGGGPVRGQSGNQAFLGARKKRMTKRVTSMRTMATGRAAYQDFRNGAIR